MVLAVRISSRFDVRRHLSRGTVGLGGAGPQAGKLQPGQGLTSTILVNQTRQGSAAKREKNTT
jgi:hypothetical protein